MSIRVALKGGASGRPPWAWIGAGVRIRTSASSPTAILDGIGMSFNFIGNRRVYTRFELVHFAHEYRDADQRRRISRSVVPSRLRFRRRPADRTQRGNEGSQ